MTTLTFSNMLKFHNSIYKYWVMRKLTFTALLCLLLTGCVGSSLVKWFEHKPADSTESVADAKSNAAGVNRMAEIAKNEAAARAELEAKYEKIRLELHELYAKRDKIDTENFTKISEINYGITVATSELVSLDRRILVANLKSKENASRLMPLTDERKKQIEEEVAVDLLKPDKDLTDKYNGLIKVGTGVSKQYADISMLVTKKEAEKNKLREDTNAALAKIKASWDAERLQLIKDSKNAVDHAREAERAEMLGWIVKILAVVGTIGVVAGLLMRSPTFAISGVGTLALAYTAATVPFWVIPTFMGVLILAMVLVNPKTGKLHSFAAKPVEQPAQPLNG